MIFETDIIIFSKLIKSIFDYNVKKFINRNSIERMKWIKEAGIDLE